MKKKILLLSIILISSFVGISQEKKQIRLQQQNQQTQLNLIKFYRAIVLLK
jgi:hypothetical protein